MSIPNLEAKKVGLTLFLFCLTESIEAKEEAGGKDESEPMGIASFLITSEEKCMMEVVWMCVKIDVYKHDMKAK